MDAKKPIDERVKLRPKMNVPEVRSRVQEFLTLHENQPILVLREMRKLWSSYTRKGDNVHGIATCLLAGAASHSIPECLTFLRDKCCLDSDWRIQEVAAMGLASYCESRGWKKAIPVIKQWMKHPNANVRRAAAEGPRIWTKRSFFSSHPEAAIELLGRLRDDNDSKVQKSVANAIKDISKSHPELVLRYLRFWSQLTFTPNAAWVLKHACAYLKKLQSSQVTSLLNALP